MQPKNKRRRGRGKKRNGFQNKRPLEVPTFDSIVVPIVIGVEKEMITERINEPSIIPDLIVLPDKKRRKGPGKMRNGFQGWIKKRVYPNLRNSRPIITNKVLDIGSIDILRMVDVGEVINGETYELIPDIVCKGYRFLLADLPHEMLHDSLLYKKALTEHERELMPAHTLGAFSLSNYSHMGQNTISGFITLDTDLDREGQYSKYGFLVSAYCTHHLCPTALDLNVCGNCSDFYKNSFFDEITHLSSSMKLTASPSVRSPFQRRTEIRVACTGGSTHFFGPASKVLMGDILELENATTVPASPNAIRVLHKNQQIGWINFKQCANLKLLISSSTTGTDMLASGVSKGVITSIMYSPILPSSQPAVLITFLHDPLDFVGLIESLNGVVKSFEQSQ